MDKIICPRCDHYIAMNGNSIEIDMWLLQDHVKNLCNPAKKYEPSLITICCNSKHWSSDEDGYRCDTCYELGFKKKYFLKDNPNWKK